MTPGVAPDPRGVLLGRYGLLHFSSLEGVVSWFRLYSAESSLDELLPGLEIHWAKTPLQSRDMLVRIPATSSYALDRASRCARLVGGSTFTGTSKHFVQYRDERSPYGYDAVEIQALPDGADLALHGEGFVQPYSYAGELKFETLLFRLTLRRVPGGDNLEAQERQELFLAVKPGLSDAVLRYLWRNRVVAQAGLVRPRQDSAFRSPGSAAPYLLVRARAVPERILRLFLTTPGIDVFTLMASNILVQVGFEHVIDLSSCTSVFAADQHYLFCGERDQVDIIQGPIELSDIEHLMRVEIDVEGARTTDASLRIDGVEAVGVEIRLAPALDSPRRVVGTLVPLDQAERVKRLVYFLPQMALCGHRVAVTDRGVLLVCSEDIDVFPLGQLLCEVAPGLLVPLGMDVVPRVNPEVLARALGHESGVLTVFPHGGPPFQVSEGAFAPLERRAVAKIEVAKTTSVDFSGRRSGDPSIVNEAVGRFALWGFPSPPEKR